MSSFVYANLPQNPTSPRRTARRRGGVTMIELLVVIMIMLMVTAAAIPVVAPAMQNRRMREAARSVSSVFASAKSRAIENGRPYGVMIERLNGQDFAMTLSYVEVPLPYTGDTEHSVMVVNGDGVITHMGDGRNVPNAPDTTWQGLLRQGDLLRLNHGGRLYNFTVPGMAPGQVIPPTSGPPTNSPWPSQSNPWQVVLAAGEHIHAFPSRAIQMHYEIIRQPVRSSAPPVQLPEGAVIDLVNSGETPITPTFGTGVTFNPVVIFSPNGSVDWVMTGNRHRPSGPLFFLLGRRELMPDVALSGADENLFEPATANPKNQHLQNFWIAIGPTTGMVSVTENAQNAGLADILSGHLRARQFAVSAQSTGGR